MMRISTKTSFDIAVSSIVLDHRAHIHLHLPLFFFFFDHKEHTNFSLKSDSARKWENIESDQIDL